MKVVKWQKIKNSERQKNLESVLYPIVPVVISQFIFKMYSIPRDTIVHQFLFLLFPTDFYITIAVDRCFYSRSISVINNLEG